MGKRFTDKLWDIAENIGLISAIIMAILFIGAILFVIIYPMIIFFTTK